jgi:hypothetical protein
LTSTSSNPKLFPIHMPLYIWSMSSFKCSFHTNTKILNCHIIFRSCWNVVQSEMNDLVSGF